MSSFNISNDGTFETVITDKSRSKRNITNLLRLYPGEQPISGSNGSLIYDESTNEFKGYINGAWQTISSGLSAFTADDQELLFYNQTSQEIDGSPELKLQ